MEVKIVFDTEKESVEELKKLIANLQQIVDKRQSGQSNVAEEPLPQQPESFNHQPKKSEQQQRQKTQGGCEIIPFQDMDDTMEKIFSGKN